MGKTEEMGRAGSLGLGCQAEVSKKKEGSVLRVGSPWGLCREVSPEDNWREGGTQRRDATH